jgi:hypothetical protein
MVRGTAQLRLGSDDPAAPLLRLTTPILLRARPDSSPPTQLRLLGPRRHRSHSEPAAPTPLSTRNVTIHGYRFIADDLHTAGHRVSERRVWRLCSQQRLWLLQAMKRGLTRKAGPPAHDDRVGRAFTAPDLDRLWLTDITEHNTAEGKLYLCAVKDACSRRIVGTRLAIACGPRSLLRARQMAVQRRNPAGTVVHSDPG